MGVAALALAAAVCPAFQAVETAPGQDPEVAKMVVQALKAEDPEQKLKLYDKILEKEPGNPHALAGYKEAKAAVDVKHAAAQEEQKKAAQTRMDKGRGEAAFNGAAAAFSGGRIAEARSKLNLAKSLGYSNPKLAEFERVVAAAEARGNFYRYLSLGGAGVLITAVTVWILSLFRKRRPYLEVLSGSTHGRRYPIDKDVVTIGAVAQKGDDKNDIVLSDPDKTVSRFHCEIHRKGKKMYVVDCHSANGTRLDGRPLPPGRLIPLPRGARIQLGMSCSLKFGYERRKP
jgi:hypothetical protein